MKIKSFNLDVYERRSFNTPKFCIYCMEPFGGDELTDEHIIPFALSHNTLIYRKASCKPCASIIQPYEQAVLRDQLGTFRLQVDAPSRSKRKDRPTSVVLEFLELNDQGLLIRDLGKRNVQLEQAPLTLSLWSLPEARILRPDAQPGDDTGKPWSFIERPRAEQLMAQISEEAGARNVAMKMGGVNREHFLRFLAKTAHAFAVAELGLDGFEPFLNDLVLNRSHDLAKFVGQTAPLPEHEIGPADTVLLAIGSHDEYLTVFISLYGSLRPPAYAVVVGRRNANTEERLKAMDKQYS